MLRKYLFKSTLMNENENFNVLAELAYELGTYPQAKNVINLYWRVHCGRPVYIFSLKRYYIYA